MKVSAENRHLRQAANRYLEYHLQGILNEKGRALYSKNKK
jgi:hypothetical protein